MGGGGLQVQMNSYVTVISFNGFLAISWGIMFRLRTMRFTKELLELKHSLHPGNVEQVDVLSC